MIEGPIGNGVDERGSTLPPLSLHIKLLLFAAALVAVPGILFGVLAQQSGSASLQRVIGHQLAREAGHTADRLGTLIEAERQTLRSFAQQDLMREIRVGDIDKRISSALATLRDGSPVRLDYLVVDREHRVIASSNPAWIGPLEPWAGAAEAVLRREERLVGPAATPVHQGPALVIGTPVPDPDGSLAVIGALVGLYDWRELTSVTRNLRSDLAKLGLEVDVLVIRRDGAIIGGNQSTSARESMRPADWSEIASIDVNEQPDYVVRAEAGLLVGRASLGSALSDWRLVIVEPLSDALAPARRLTTRLALTLGLALAVALALATLAARRVLRPLSELTLAIRGLPSGESSSLRVPVRTEDEVGALARAFNRMASELDQAQRDLVEAAKFAFVGELAAGVAHEVRTSLGVLRSSAQILERSLPARAGSEATELAQLIRAEVDRLGSVVSDLVGLARPRTLQLEATPISRPVFRAADLVEPQAHESGIQIHRVPMAVDPTALCDAEAVYQVALNLLVNAIQALEDGGHIEVRIRRAKDGYAGFEVRDDGPGIPEELRGKIFLPFSTAREGGAGLGLTFVKRVVHEHRGRISLETGSGSGTCFRVELPPVEATS
jgi:signal transduction histidine kinase